MASPGHEYLPDLKRCFDGDAIAFSWAETFRTLSSSRTQLEPRSLNTFISSPKVKSILKQKIPSFPLPSQQAQNQLDTSTAPISITPAVGKNYDVEEIKKNARWLSSELKLAEDEALRIGVLTWQQEPVERITSGYSDAELASLRDALGQSVDLSEGLGKAFPERINKNLNSVDLQRNHFVDVYFREQIGLLGVARLLQEVAMLGSSSTLPDNLKAFANELDITKSNDPGIVDVVHEVGSRLSALGAGRSWSLDTDETNDRWIATELKCILTLQELLLLRIRGCSDTIPTETVIKWLEIMAGCEFFVGIQPNALFSSSEVESLQATSAIATLAVLDPATANQALTDMHSTNPSWYFLNGDVAHDVHRILLPAAEACIPQAGPAAFAWSLILSEIKRQASSAKEARESGAVQRAIDQVSTLDTATGRRTSTGSLQQSIYEDVLGAILNTSSLQEPATYLLRCTIEAGHVFDTISILAKDREYRTPLLTTIALQVLQELLSVAVTSIGYSPDILISEFALLSNDVDAASDLPDARETFIKNNFLMDSIFAVAAGRFPYESLAFVRLCRLLSSAKVFDDQGTQYITFRLRALDSYTQLAMGMFASYHTIREDENLNLVALDNTAIISQGTQQYRISDISSQAPTTVIPSDTIGEVISEAVPPVIKWQHTYSGLSLLGSWVEMHYLGQLHAILPPYETAEDVATECITLFKNLLQNTISGLPSSFNQESRNHLQNEVLDEATASLQADSTIADYVFEILEQELQAYRRRPSNTFNTSLLIACVDFAVVYVQVQPDKFWAVFSKSSLLDSYGSDGYLLSVVSGVEVPNQTFTFLQSCTTLFGQLISAIVHQSKYTNPKQRQQKGHITQPQNLRIYTGILLSLTRSLYVAFEAIPSWSFISRHQQTNITNDLARSFERILVYSNGTVQSKSGTTNFFVSASDFLVSQLRLNADDISSTAAVTRQLFRIAELRSLTGASSSPTSYHDAVSSLLSLATTVIKIGQQQSDQASALEQQLFNAIPLFCRNIADTLDQANLCVIRTLLDIVSKATPVSLLGHLGSTTSIDFLEILKLNTGDWISDTLKSSIWELLAQLVSRNQQWLAVVILTGSPPERTGKEEPEQRSKNFRGRTFMDLALKQLARISELDQRVSVSILKFVIRAQMNWSWANEVMKSDKDFLPAVMSYVCNTYVDVNDELKTSYRNRIAALVTDLCTIHLHHAKAKRDTTTLKTIVPLLRWLTANAIETSSYNHSLHSNLRNNFASKFTGLDIGDFKRSGLFEANYGDRYYYELDFVNEVLGPNSQIVKLDKFRDQSFSAEIRRANLNLSVVDSEVKLLNSFLNLCVEHSGYLAQDSEVQRIVVEIVKNCLLANTQAYPPEKIFENVLQVRADIAISLLQRLVDAKAKGPEVRVLLKYAWECARHDNGSFEQAIISNSLTYWRSMLTVVLMALQSQVDKQYMPPAADASPAALFHHSEQAISTILEIITVVVGQGFRSVATALQEQRQSKTSNGGTSTPDVSHKDISLILTIFETILRMARLPEFVSEASQRLVVGGVISSCLLLYSWSHVLTSPELDNEPVYAGYCLRFLVSLSSLPPVTEELAVEGVLSRLLSSRLTQKLQAIPDGAAHVDKRPHVQTLYNLWATGLLPICLNLLHSVGAPVAAEVSIFLNQFPNQLNRASVAFVPSQSRSGNGDAITSTVASEANTLALISYILSSFRNAGASAAVDPATIQTLMGYDEHKKALVEDIGDIVTTPLARLKTRVVATDEKELSLTRNGDGEALSKKILIELQNTAICLRGGDTEDDK